MPKFQEETGEARSNGADYKRFQGEIGTDYKKSRGDNQTDYKKFRGENGADYKRFRGDNQTDYKKFRGDNRRLKRQTERESTKACFNCRKFGHLLADCPEAVDDPGKFGSICFKCGAADHTSARCPQKGSGKVFVTALLLL